MPHRLILPISLLLIAGGALALRLPQLGIRPMHADESVQAQLFRRLWVDSRYEYNPDEFHGPTLNFATLPVVWLGGYEYFSETNEATYRLVPVVFSAGLILLLWLIRDGLGAPAVICAAVLTAISPAMMFYSRYYIHETLFVFFTLAAIGAGWRYARSGRLAWCLTTGALLGLVQATKETSVLVFAAMAIGLGATAVWSYISPAEEEDQRPKISGWHLAAGFGVALLVAVTLLSSFFTNLQGALDGVLTYLPWIGRATDKSLHVHPWYYHLQILGWWQRGNGPWWSEGMILLLAAAGFVMALLPGRMKLLPGASVAFVRWVGFYTVLLTAAYCVIPYKTPWCLLGFLHGMILLAGAGAVALVRIVPTWPAKIVLIVALAAGTSHLAWQAYRASYPLAHEPTNPYVYAQTRAKFLKFSEQLDQLARAASEGRAVKINVVWDSSYVWPLPWYLRKFDDVNLACTGQVPPNVAAPIVICSVAHDEALTGLLGETHTMVAYHEMRPGVLALLWVEDDLWRAHLVLEGKL